MAGLVDFSLFFAGGWVMDRFGRLWTAVPSMVGLGVGHLALAATAFLPGTVWWFIGIAMFLSLSNGIGAGILMTLGADLAERATSAVARPTRRALAPGGFHAGVLHQRRK